MRGFKEKRRNPRAKIKLSAVIDTAKQLITGETANIGVDGAFISCSQPLEPRQIFNIAIIDVPLLDCRLVATAEVVWSNIDSTVEDSSSRGMGVQFIRVSSEDRKWVSAAVLSYLSTENENQTSVK